MVKNEELIKFIFKETDKISYSKWSHQFLDQILNSSSTFVFLDIDEDKDLHIWGNGIWRKGIWKDGIWQNGIWKDGIWEDGIWDNGFWRKGGWEKGVWIKGKILNKNTNKYQESKLSPDEVEWSLSYDKK